MKKIFFLLSIVSLFCGCDKNESIPDPQRFVRLSNISGTGVTVQYLEHSFHIDNRGECLIPADDWIYGLLWESDRPIFHPDDKNEAEMVYLCDSVELLFDDGIRTVHRIVPQEDRSVLFVPERHNIMAFHGSYFVLSDPTVGTSVPAGINNYVITEYEYKERF